MVKKAEKIKKRNPLLPVFGLITAVIMFVLAMFASQPAVQLLRRVTPFNPTGRPFNPTGTPPVYFPSGEYLWMSIAIWLLFLVLAYTLVAILGGRNPESAKGIQLPPRDTKKKY